MNAHIVEENPPAEEIKGEAPTGEPDARHVNPFGTFALNNDGAYLLPYEKLISPDVIESPGAVLAVAPGEGASRQIAGARLILRRTAAVPAV